MEQYLKIFKKAYPDREVTGYWVVNNGYVFNTKSLAGYSGCAQFLVTKDGQIYGTNPANSHLDPRRLVKLKK